MSRKNFLSTDFFVTASEAEAKQAVGSLPQHLTHLTLLKENPLLNSLRFLFEEREKQVQYYVDVTMLPLNDQYVRLSLHVSYTNGRGIHNDAELSPVLQGFEQAVQAAVKNDFTTLHTVQKVKPSSKKSFYLAGWLLSVFVSKYHY